MKQKTILLTLTGAMLCAAPASAAVLFFEGFETGTTTAGTSVTGRAPDVDNTTNDAVVWNATGTNTATIQAGTGTNTTNVMRLTNSGGNSSFVLGDIGARVAVGQFSSDFRWTVGTASFGFGADIQTSLNSSGVNGNRLRVSPTAANSGLAVDEWASMTIVFNGTASSINYAGGTESLAAGTADLWINNTRVSDDIPRMGTLPADGFDFFGIRSFAVTDPVGVVEFDNFELNDVITIPEPSIFLLSGFGLLGLVIRRRRA